MVRSIGGRVWGNLLGAVEGDCHGHETDERRRRSGRDLGEEAQEPLDQSVCGDGTAAALTAGADVCDDD